MALFPYSPGRFILLFLYRFIGLIYCLVMMALHNVLGSIPLVRHALDISNADFTSICFGALAFMYAYYLIKMFIHKDSCCSCCMPKKKPKKKKKQSTSKFIQWVDSLFGADGYFGRRGVDFELQLLFRELIEIPTQSYQAVQVSAKVVKASYSTFYGLALVTNCIFVPVLMRFGSLTTMQRRNNILLFDAGIDITLGAIIPLMLLLSQPIQLINDPSIVTDLEFNTIGLSMTRHVVVHGYFDLFIKALPLLASLEILDALHYNLIEDAERRARKLRKRGRETIHKDGVDKIAPTSGVAPSTLIAVPHPRLRRWRVLIDYVFGIVSVLWSAGLVFLLIRSNVRDFCTADIAHATCVQQVRPWLGEVACNCLFVHVDCDRPIAGSDLTIFKDDREKTLQVFNKFLSTELNQDTLISLSIDQCALDHMPEAFDLYKDTMMMFMIRTRYGIPLKSFKTRVQDFNQLLFIYIGDGTLGLDVPEALKTLPPSLLYLALSNNRLTSLPEWVGPSWQNVVFLFLTNNSLSTLPESFYSLTNIVGLHLKMNDFTSLDDRIGGFSSLTDLDVGGNLLTRLPQSFKDLPLVHVNLDSNLITSVENDLPWSADTIERWSSVKGQGKSTNKLTLANNPVCDTDDRIRNSVACQPDCAPLCDIREFKRKYCSLTCNTTACGYHEARCLPDYVFARYNPLTD